jgi:hypothetical protein
MEGVITGETAVYKAAEAPYPPSWVDRVTDRVRALPVPAWIVYLVPALILFVITTGIHWEDGSYAAAYAAGNKAGIIKLGPIYIYPFHAVPELVAFYALALMHYLDDVARHALDTFRPAMRNTDEAHWNSLSYRLTTMPARPTLLASVAGVVFAACVLIVIYFAAPGFANELVIFTSPAAIVVESAVFVLLWWIWGALIYHTIRQLRLVSHIYTTYARIDVFNLTPLYSFSWLTARTGVGVVLATYLFILTGPGLLENPITLGIMAFNVLFAVVAFAWPLVGVHRLIEDAKNNRLGSIAKRFETMVTELHKRADAAQYGAMGEIKGGLDALNSESGVIEKVYTWPWKRETVSGLSTAILLPIALWLITRFLNDVIK